MNFLLRSTSLAAAAAEQPSLNENAAIPGTKVPTTLEGLVSGDPFPRYGGPEDSSGDVSGGKDLDRSISGLSTSSDASCIDNHSDVSEKEGWITIPCKELPEDWTDASDIHSLRALDRNFIFPGEQVHIVACLSMCEEDTEVITPFKVAAVMSKNGIGQNGEKENGNSGDGKDPASENTELHQDKQNNPHSPSKGNNTDLQKDISAGESLLRMEDRNRKIATLLQRFKNSHFFVRISESDEILWSKKDDSKKSSSESTFPGDKISDVNGARNSLKPCINTVVNKGGHNANVSGGVARNNVRCWSLANGDLVVVLQVSVGVDLLKDPAIEILQFEKYQTKGWFSSSEKNEEDITVDANNNDPCGGLLTWLLPMENSLPPPPVRPVSPPVFGSSSSSGVASSTSGRPNIPPATPGSQIFSFGHFRSYSMSAIPQTTSIPPPSSAAHGTGHASKSSYDFDDRDWSSKEQPAPSPKTGKDLLSFRSVLLEPERFSVRCGLEGVYIPGRRWRRKLEIVQPIQIQSFAADCNSDDLLCVQIKNISPAHIPDVVVYIDAITIVLEDSARGGPPISFPIASVESGEDYTLPNLALRKGEEHSFIVKPATCAWKKLNSHHDRKTTRSSSSSSQQPQTKKASRLHVSSKIVEVKNTPVATDRYAVMVSCHCNCTESRLFFKQPTSWQPRISRDILISVASETSRDILGPDDVASQFPVQVLTLRATNLTTEDLTMTMLAPASFTAPPTVVSLSATPKTPFNPFFGLTEFQGGSTSSPHNIVSLVTRGEQKRHIPFEQASSVSDGDILNTDVACTHLWLQSRVPLGCVPSQTTTTIKLELLPLTDGIITLDTLHIDVKEKGCSYVPENSLKINATSSISSGII